MYNKLNIGSSYRISGKLYFFSNTFQLIHPSEVINEKDIRIFEELEPRYNLARKKLIRNILEK